MDEMCSNFEDIICGGTCPGEILRDIIEWDFDEKSY